MRSQSKTLLSPQNPGSDITTGSDAFHGMSQMKSKSQGWYLTEKARLQALISDDPSFALLDSALERFEDLIDREPCAWEGPQQGHQAVVCHARDIAIAHVLNDKTNAKDTAAWVRWLHIAGHETSVGGLPSLAHRMLSFVGSLYSNGCC